MTTLAGTIGTGNIAGVATAISLGGPGALFWMWLTAIEGMATKFVEYGTTRIYGLELQEVYFQMRQAWAALR